LTHLYSYFGLLLGCTKVGTEGFPAYGGDASMYNVHKHMALDAYEVSYFINQVGLAAASFGVTQEDISYVGGALQALFGHRCAPAMSIVPGTGKELQAICLAVSSLLKPQK